MAEVIIVTEAREGAGIVADEIVRLIRRRPDAVLGLATGSTPLSLYDALQLQLAGVDVTRVRGFALDEYVGIEPTHPESYRSVITRDVVIPLGLDPTLVRTPDGAMEYIEKSGTDYEEAIVAVGGVDLQILGIGTDGHIGFNEPGSSFASRTRVKTLTQQTRADNARYFETPDDVPTLCITQGLGTILQARHLVLLAFGEGKAGAAEGPVTASLPGSAIQPHQHVTVVVDEAAASRLREAAYYRYAWRKSRRGRASEVTEIAETSRKRGETQTRGSVRAADDWQNCGERA